MILSQRSGNFWLPALLAMGLSSCSEAPGVPDETLVPYRPDFPAQPAEGAPGPEGLQAPVDDSPPTVSVTAAPAPCIAVGGMVTLEVEASDDVAVVAAQVRVGSSPAFPVAPESDLRAFVLSLAVPPGETEIEVTVYDVSGDSGSRSITCTRPPLDGTGQPPSVSIGAPASGTALSSSLASIWGTAADDVGIASVSLRIGDIDVAAESTDQWATWYAAVPLPGGGPVTVTATATDFEGLTTSADVELVAAFAGDDEPPFMQWIYPVEGLTLTDPVVRLRGLAADNVGVVAVLVGEVGQPLFPATLTGSETHAEFATETVPSSPSTTFIAVAVDTSGNTTTITRAAEVSPSPDWGWPLHTTLRWGPADAPEVLLELDRDLVAEALPPEKAEQIVLLNLDTTPMLTAALDWIRTACGPLPIAEGVEPTCPDDWGQSERNLWRLLTMTSRTADVSDTSFANLAEIANVLSAYDNLIDDFSTLLALTLDADLDDTLVSSGAIAESIRTNLIATHPEALPDGRLPITLQDALSDMASLHDRFGIQSLTNGEHPGFLPSEPVASVLTDDFQLVMSAQSRLHWHEGVALGDRKGFAPLLAAGAPDPLDIDFSDPEKFDVLGLVDEPIVDLPFFMQEHPDYLVSAPGTAVPPPAPGDSPVFDLATPWVIERVVADAAAADYGDFHAGCDLCESKDAGALLWEIVEVVMQDNDLAEVTVGTTGYALEDAAPKNFPLLEDPPAGWMRVWTLGGIGYPADVDKSAPWTVGYLWDVISEVAQQRLRDGGIPEGAGSIAILLDDIPVGLTAEDIVEATRETLAEQKSLLVELMLGNFAANADVVDFFLVRRDSGTLYLALRTPSDPSVNEAPPVPTAWYEDAALRETTGVVWPAGEQPEGVPPSDEPRAAISVTSAKWSNAFLQAPSGGVYRVRTRLAPHETEAVEVLVQEYQP